MKQQAKDMWITLKNFDKAKRIGDDFKGGASSSTAIPESKGAVVIQDRSTNSMLMKQEAEWKEKIGEWREAGDLYLKADDLKKAIEVFSKNLHVEGVIEVCRAADSETQRKEIELCTAFFRKHKHYQYSKEALLKLQDAR